MELRTARHDLSDAHFAQFSPSLSWTVTGGPEVTYFVAHDVTSEPIGLPEGVGSVVTPEGHAPRRMRRSGPGEVRRARDYDLFGGGTGRRLR
jgi:hypothetical protein